MELSPHAASTIKKLPSALQDVVIEHLERLGSNPVELSRPAPTPPYVPGFQGYTFDALHEAIEYSFTVLFKYRADESTLWVYGVGMVRYGADSGD